jgi:hypothetical protein
MLLVVIVVLALVLWALDQLLSIAWATRTIPSVLRECRRSAAVAFSWVVFLVALMLTLYAHFDLRSPPLSAICGMIALGGAVGAVFLPALSRERSGGAQQGATGTTVELTRGERRYLATAIPKWLREGRAKQAIIEDIAELGVDREWAARFVENVAGRPEPPDHRPPDSPSTEPGTARLTRQERRHLAKLIPQRLAQGTPQQSIVQELVELGVDREWAVHFVEEAATKARDDDRSPADS